MNTPNFSLKGTGSRASIVGLLISLFLAFDGNLAPVSAQFSSYESYQRAVPTTLGVADTLTEKLLEQRQAIRAGYDAQALEGPVDPNTYILGPGDGVYLDVFSVHSLDQDLTVTPDGKLLVPKSGAIQVAGLTVVEAEKQLNALLAKDYRNPNASLSLRKLRAFKVSVLGEVLSPGVQSANSMQRLSEVIDKSGGFKPHSSLRNIEIRRPDGSLRAKADLVRYFSTTDLNANPVIESGDVIYVPKSEKHITLAGSVATPNVYEFASGDSLSTLIKIAGGLLPDAQVDSIEISRFDKDDPKHAHRIYVNYGAGQNPTIADGDAIFIRSISKYHLQHLVSVAGEVNYPGEYAIDEGKTRLLDLLDRAGGVLPTASLEEAILIRRQDVGSGFEPEFNRLATQFSGNQERMTNDEFNYYLARFRQFGRSTSMVVDFKALLEHHDESQNILLKGEDSLWFPRGRGYVNVTGCVNEQGNVLYSESSTFFDYIEKAGGYTSSADRGAVRVINARTSSYIDPSSDRSYRIGPGDIIVVPEARPDFWKNFALVTAITAQVVTIIVGVLLVLQKK